MRVWQLIDSAFPAGGFTHSGGLEAAAQHGDVTSAEDVHRFACAVVRQAGRGALPFVLAAHRNPHDLPALDAFADLFLNQPVSNRASRAQGTSLLNAAVRIFPEAPLEPIAETVRRHDLCGHHAPIFGAVLAGLGVDSDTTVRMFLYQSMRTVFSAAVRLGIAGTFEGQRLQATMAVEVDRTLEQCRDVKTSEVAQTTPIFDLYQSTHDRLYSRLFQS